MCLDCNQLANLFTVKFTKYFIASGLLLSYLIIKIGISYHLFQNWDILFFFSSHYLSYLWILFDFPWFFILHQRMHNFVFRTRNNSLIFMQGYIWTLNGIELWQYLTTNFIMVLVVVRRTPRSLPEEEEAWFQIPRRWNHFWYFDVISIFNHTHDKTKL